VWIESFINREDLLVKFIWYSHGAVCQSFTLYIILRVSCDVQINPHDLVITSDMTPVYQFMTYHHAVVQ
jgi:hypothetical protein